MFDDFLEGEDVGAFEEGLVFFGGDFDASGEDFEDVVEVLFIADVVGDAIPDFDDFHPVSAAFFEAFRGDIHQIVDDAGSVCGGEDGLGSGDGFEGLARAGLPGGDGVDGFRGHDLGCLVRRGIDDSDGIRADACFFEA